MNRKAAFHTNIILNTTLAIILERGPAAATMAAIAARMGGPTGSIYHRFPSRAALLAELWLSAAERFQAQFVDGEFEPAFVTGLTFRFCHEFPAESSVLLRHRVTDFLQASWPESAAQRAQILRNQLQTYLQAAASHHFGCSDKTALRRVRLALCELPLAAVKPHLEAGEAIPAHLCGDVGQAAAAILRGGA